METVLCERSFPEYFSQICMKEAREQLYMQKPEMLLSFESVAWKVWKYRRDTAACERMLVTHISQKAFFQTGAGNSVITMNRQMGADVA